MSVRVIHADSREALKDLPDGSIDSVATDPPYALVSIVKRFANSPRSEATENTNNPYGRTGRGFMGQRWDTGETAFDPSFWAEVLRVLKPGGHLVACGGTRTYHRLVCAIEDAGFEIRDQLAWLYGSGFPKSHNVSKSLDRAADYKFKAVVRRAAVAAVEAAGLNLPGNSRHDWTIGEHAPGDKWWAEFQAWLPHLSDGDRERVEGEILATVKKTAGWFTSGDIYTVAAPATAEAAAWEGWGTALKPALEPIVLARKPLGTVGVNVQEMVEKGLRIQGVEGDIQWVSESAKGAAKQSRPGLSSSTAAPLVAEISAETVAERVTSNGGMRTGRSSGKITPVGEAASGNTSGNTLRANESGCDPKFSPLMAEIAPVAESKSGPSSPSTTSEAAEPLTGRASTARSTNSCGVMASRPDTESYAGIATGLSGSRAHVHISRNADGSFAWPKGLPKRLDPQPLTVAANVLAHGTGALNVDGCRISTGGEKISPRGSMDGATDIHEGWARPWMADEAKSKARLVNAIEKAESLGRWPANVVHDGSDEVVGAFPATGPGSGAARNNGDFKSVAKGNETAHVTFGHEDGGGSAARFFYSAKADAEDRLGSKHPTVKPVDLMRWLVRLITPPGGVVLDPFAGSGSTGVAAMAEGFDAILIEREARFVADIERRIAWAKGEGRLTAQEMARLDTPEAQAKATGHDLPLFAGDAA